MAYIGFRIQEKKEKIEKGGNIKKEKKKVKKKP